MAYVDEELIKDKLLNNTWEAGHVLHDDSVVNLVNTGLLTPNSELHNLISGWDPNNIPSTFSYGLHYFLHDKEWARPKIGGGTLKLSNQKAIETNIKTYFVSRGWTINDLQQKMMSLGQDILRVGKRNEGAVSAMIRRVFSHDASLQIQDLIAAHFENLSKVPEVVIGNDQTILTHKLILDIRNKFGDKGWNESLGNFYMNSKTWHHILVEQSKEGGQIEKNFFIQRTATTMDVNSGSFINNPLNYTYYYSKDMNSRVYVNDSMQDGLIALVRPGAFFFSFNRVAPLFRTKEDVLEDVGGGITGLLVNYKFLLHPQGFSFDNSDTTKYHPNGPTLAELKAATPLFKILSADPHNAKLNTAEQPARARNKKPMTFTRVQFLKIKHTQ